MPFQGVRKYSKLIDMRIMLPVKVIELKSFIMALIQIKWPSQRIKGAVDRRVSTVLFRV